MKTILRNKINKKLKNFNHKKVILNSKKIHQRLFSIKVFQKAQKIGLYFSKENEVSTKEIISNLLKKHKKVFLPKIQNETLEFRQIKNIKDLQVGPFNIYEPKPNYTKISAQK